MNVRVTRGFTVREFAEKCGVSPSTVSRMEIHGDLPKIDVIFQIAQALDMSIVEVLSHAYPNELAGLVELARTFHELTSENQEVLLDYGRSLARDPIGGGR